MKLINNTSNHVLYTISSLVVLSSVLFFSCDDLLEEKPKAMVEETFFTSVEEVETAVNAIYTPIRSGEGMSVYEATLECSADYAYGRGSWAQISEYSVFNDTNINRVARIWQQFYLSIRNANLVIKNSPQDKKYQKLIVEAKYLRAFCYFQLARNWGGVPIRTEKNMTDIDLKKSSINEVYDFILKDLEEAETKLPEKQSVAGRPTIWAAKTLLADVYLELKKYPEARDKANEVIASNHFSLVPVKTVENFQENVFGPALISTTEEIFYLKYARLSGQQNYMLWIINHASTGVYNYGGAYAVYSDLTNPVYANWDENDLRKKMWENTEFGLGKTTLVSTKFGDNEAIDKNGGGNDDPIYGYSDILLIFAEASVKAANAPTKEAMEALNQIRRRAYGYNPKETSTLDYKHGNYTIESFISLVMKERSYEFQMEGKRWLELKRTGKAKEIIKKTKGLDVSDHYFLWPIPISEMNYNKALDPNIDQNPGY
ncbi:RagB/SusD family nutrient uptake outer membrane protein [Massilibacteroides vaginae]|uniref:RagB/SusD family nutrient uptake outer membrane protein n=1 Tax=Massilibacteroides vaginae TaxID=1673718 RepID=UPI000A1C8036|nr:RagB/SusD family nutrient uptake outer membrane protein [Massilibacteroides vaginae]